MKTHNYLNQKLTTEKEAILFIHKLAVEDKLFHFDDDVEDLINNPFSKDEIPLIKARVDELFDLLDDPFEHSITAFEAVSGESVLGSTEDGSLMVKGKKLDDILEEVQTLINKENKS